MASLRPLHSPLHSPLRLRTLVPFGLAIATSFAAACDDGTAHSTDDVTDVKNSSVKNQAIGNCWVYATVGWAESLRLTHSGEELNLSESWVSYWHWYEQIAGGPPDETAVSSLDKNQISTGGWWGVGVEIMRRYGVLSEGAFIPEDAEAARSSRQSSALSAINTSLKSGVLSDASKRRDRKVVRAELDKAWGLSAELSAMLDAAYGADVQRTFSKGKATVPAASSLRVTADIEVGSGASGSGISLLDAIGAPVSRYDVKKRTGKYAWNEVSYPSGASDRRKLLGRMQEAMHDGMPVILTWFVDFAAMKGNAFQAPPATPGRQGGHMTVVEDYQVSNVPGFGTLEAGTLVTDPAALDAALDPRATVDFLRIKNSWGSSLAPPNAGEDLRGYHDLHMAYLDGPLTRCTAKDGDACGIKSQTAGLWGLTLPPPAFLTDRKGVEGTCLDPCTVGPARAVACGTCEATICEDDPYCCSTAWDATCAEAAQATCDGACGG